MRSDASRASNARLHFSWEGRLLLVLVADFIVSCTTRGSIKYVYIMRMVEYVYEYQYHEYQYEYISIRR